MNGNIGGVLFSARNSGYVLNMVGYNLDVSLTGIRDEVRSEVDLWPGEILRPTVTDIYRP